VVDVHLNYSQQFSFDLFYIPLSLYNRNMFSIRVTVYCLFGRVTNIFLIALVRNCDTPTFLPISKLILVPSNFGLQRINFLTPRSMTVDGALDTFLPELYEDQLIP